MSVSMIDVALAGAWRPVPGDELVGAVVHRDIRTTEHGTYPVVYIAPVDSDPNKLGSLIAVHAFHTTLRDGLKELSPQRGQIISIVYAGTKESNSRTDAKGEKVEYHHYVVSDPDATLDEGAIDWDNVPF